MITVTYGIYRQRSHDAVLVNRVRTLTTAKRQARELGRSTLEQYFVDEENWGSTRLDSRPAGRIRVFQTPVGRYTEPTPGLQQHGEYRFGGGQQ